MLYYVVKQTIFRKYMHIFSKLLLNINKEKYKNIKRKKNKDFSIFKIRISRNKIKFRIVRVKRLFRNNTYIFRKRFYE